jgi:hypothetical protein
MRIGSRLKAPTDGRRPANESDILKPAPSNTPQAGPDFWNRLGLRSFVGHRSLWLFAALAAAFAYVAVDSAARIRHLAGMEKLYGVQVAPPRPDAASPTGYALGRRTLIEPGNSADTYHLVIQTQQMLAGGSWRLHHVDYDNAPYGREMHWSSPPRWWLAFLALIDHGVSGRSIGAAAEQAVLYANPLLLAIFILGAIPLVARRFGPTGAALMAIGVVASHPFYLNFIAGDAEHQGVAEVCGLLTVVCLLGGAGGWAGSARAEAAKPGELPAFNQARRWFLASAVAGGVGLWLSAASEVPVLAGTGLGAIAALAVIRRRLGPEGGTFRPELWRFWGVAGCVASFAAYAIEYFPSQMGWRLEVNHPLYGLAWLGGGELICQIGRHWAPGARNAGIDRRLAIGAAILVGLLPAVVLFTHGRTFWVADPFLWRLHTGYIAEFHSMFWDLAQSGWNFSAIARVLPLLLSIPSLVFLLRRGTPGFWKAQLMLALVPAGLEFALAAQQLRWWGLASGLAFATLLPLFELLEKQFPGRPARIWRLTCALLLAPGAVNAVTFIPLESANFPANLRALAVRDLAHWLRLRAGNDPVVVLSTPDTTTSLIYHGSFRGLGTLYWENRDGLEAAAEIFAAATPDEARALILRRHVTQIVLVSWDPFVAPYVQLARGLPVGAPWPPGSFADLLQGRGPLPPWLRPIPYPLPPNPNLKGQRVWIFEVTNPQRPEDILVRNAEFLMEMGLYDHAAELQPALRGLDSYFPALAELTRIEGQRSDADGVENTVARIEALGTPPSDLAAEDQVRLAVALAIGGRLDPARRVLERCLDRMDEKTLRQFTAGTLSDLLSLCDHLGVAIPDPALRSLAAELLPPRLR